MVFQARKWDWKRVAARLLLVPVLAGGSAAIADAQMQTSPGGLGLAGAPPAKSASRPVGPKAPAGDPKE